MPSKAFGEYVEETCHTPNITAPELKARLDAGDDLVVLDSRPLLPHLTLVRQARSRPSGAAPGFAWHADHFGLYLSTATPGGVRYDALGRWPLAAP